MLVAKTLKKEKKEKTLTKKMKTSPDESTHKHTEA